MHNSCTTKATLLALAGCNSACLGTSIGSVATLQEWSDMLRQCSLRHRFPVCSSGGNSNRKSSFWRLVGICVFPCRTGTSRSCSPSEVSTPILTVWRWFQRYAPQIQRRLRSRKRAGYEGRSTPLLHTWFVQRGDGLILRTLSPNFALTPKLQHYRSKCRPLKRSCAEVGSIIPAVIARCRAFQQFAPEPPQTREKRGPPKCGEP